MGDALIIIKVYPEGILFFIYIEVSLLLCESIKTIYIYSTLNKHDFTDNENATVHCILRKVLKALFPGKIRKKTTCVRSLAH